MSSARSRWVSWPAVLTGLGVVLLLGGVGWLVLVRVRQGSEAADAAASVVAAFVAALTGVAALLGAQHRRWRAARLPATADQIEHAAATLAGLVREQWGAEADVRALSDPEPMPVRWRVSTPDLMDHPDVVDPDGPVTFSGRSDWIEALGEAFLALPRRRLVITGGPGSGKTTLAVQLVLQLLAATVEGRRAPVPVPVPVPVLFSLSDWDPANQPRIQDWVATQLTQTYPALRSIAPDAAVALAEQHRVLPVLDGLDEVTADRRAAIIGALNSVPSYGLIITSRRPEYRDAITDAGDALTGAAVIGPLALTPTDAADYLRKHLPSRPHPAWESVVASLTASADVRTAAGTTLAQLTATPLGLWLVRAVYLDTRRDPSPLIDDSATTPTALRAHLLDGLIPALLGTRPPLSARRRDATVASQRPARKHRPDDLRRWLTTLAGHLQESGTRDWRWWELVRYAYPTRRARTLLRAA